MPRATPKFLLFLLGWWLLTGCATGRPDRPPTKTLNAPQNNLAACLELASEVAQHPPSHARGRAARDRYLTMCLESR
jgi:hypothetical protein